MKRLGKVRGHVLDALELAGGSATLQELAEILHHRRPRDLRRRTLPMLEEAGIITVEDDQVTLADNWLEALDVAREIGGEIEAEERARRDLEKRRRAYHSRQKTPPTPHWTNNPDADGVVEDLRPVEDEDEPEVAPEVEEVEVLEESPAVAFVLDYVGRLGKVRLGLLEQIWLEDHGGDLAELRRAVDASGVREMRLPEYRNSLFLYPPLEDRGAA